MSSHFKKRGNAGSEYCIYCGTRRRFRNDGLFLCPRGCEDNYTESVSILSESAHLSSKIHKPDQKSRWATKWK